MFQTIIVGVDGREQDDEAFALANRLAAPGAEIIAANIAVIEDALLRITAPTLQGRLLDHAEDIADGATEARPQAEAVVTEAESVGRGLRELALGAHADLIVVASSRRGFLGRVFAGDAVRDVLRNAPCSVAVAPVGAGAQGPLERIVVGYDASPESEAALRQALELGHRDGASVGVVAVVEPQVAVAAMAGAYAGNALDDAYEKAQADAARVQAEHDVHGVVAVGSAAHELAEAARGADLLAIGLRNYGLVDRLLIGSTGHALLREQSAPMLITPPEAVRGTAVDALDPASERGREPA